MSVAPTEHLNARLIALEMIRGVEHGEPALEAARVLAAYIRALSAEYG